MASFKSHPLFYTSLLLAGAITAGQAWLLFSQRSAAQRVAAEIEQKQQTLAAFSAQTPFPSRENLAMVEADRLAVEKTRNDIRSALRANSEVATQIASAVVPGSSLDAYFDIANYLERVRAQARSAKVFFAPENRFGFSSYSVNGPERGLIVPVFQQRQYAEYLIGALLTSAHPPTEFVSLLRERPLTPEQKVQLTEAIAAGQQAPSFGDSGGADFFVMDPRTSARVAGFVETIPFRLTFVGNTSVLRGFLNELALFKVPVVVRSVEIESVGAGAQSISASPKSSNHPASFGGAFGAEQTTAAPDQVVKPLVEQVDSRFIVTVEIVSLVDKTAPAVDASAQTVPVTTP